MDDGLDAMLLDHTLDQVLVGGIADEQRHALRDKRREAGGEIVDHHHALTGLMKRANGVASDIAGPAGH